MTPEDLRALSDEELWKLAALIVRELDRRGPGWAHLAAQEILDADPDDLSHLFEDQE